MAVLELERAADVRRSAEPARREAGVRLFDVGARHNPASYWFCVKVAAR
jgi:hypothetical protein